MICLVSFNHFPSCPSKVRRVFVKVKAPQDQDTRPNKDMQEENRETGIMTKRQMQDLDLCLMFAGLTLVAW